MTTIEVIGLVGLVGLTFIRKDVFLYLICSPACIAYGMYWYSSFHHPAGFVFSLVLIGIGLYSLIMGGYNLVKRTQERGGD